MRRIYHVLSIFVLLVGLSACAKVQPTWQEQYDLGVRYLSDGNYEEAIIAFTAAIEIDPKRAEAYVGRGDAYVASGETEENLTAAQLDYEKAIKMDELFAEAYLGLADVYIRQGDYENAIEVLQDGLEKISDNEIIADKISEIEMEIDELSNKPKPMTGYPKTERKEFDNGQYYILEYNEYGSDIRDSLYNQNDELVQYTEYTYDKQQCLTMVISEWIIVDRDSGGVPSKTIDYIDGEDRCYKTEVYSEDSDYIVEYEYTDGLEVIISFHIKWHKGDWFDGSMDYSSLQYTMENKDHVVRMNGHGGSGREVNGQNVVQSRNVQIEEYRKADTFHGCIMNTDDCIATTKYEFDTHNELIETERIK